MVRQGVTSRTWQFKPDAATMSDLRNGAGIEVDNGGQGNIVRVKGRSYPLDNLDPSTTPPPSCQIDRILRLSPPNGNSASPDPKSSGTYYLNSMGIMVSTKGPNKAARSSYHVTVRNRSALDALKVGHDVSMVTDAGPGEWAGRNWAVVRVETGGRLQAYSFPVSIDANPEGPSSTVIFTDSAARTVTIRDNKTGRTLQFNAGTTPLEDLHPNTGIEISGGNNNLMGNVDSIRKFYALNEPTPGAPCCSVSVINGGVTTVDKAAGATHHIAVDNLAAKAAIKVGQTVSMDPSGKWALFQLKLDGQLSTYSFPIDSEGKSTEHAAETVALWEIKPNAELKGALGRLVFGFTDSDAIGAASIRPVGQKEEGKLVFFDAQVPLPPGKYEVNANGALVRDVPVEYGMETVIKVGVLSVTAGVKAGIYDKSKNKELKFVDGGKTILPIGTYYLKVNGVFALVVIKEKQVTEF